MYLRTIVALLSLAISPMIYAEAPKNQQKTSINQALLKAQDKLQVSGDTLFLLDAKPLLNPRYPNATKAEQDQYWALIKQRIQKRNAKADAEAFSATGQTYLLHYMLPTLPASRIHVSWMGATGHISPTMPPQPRIEHSSPYGYLELGFKKDDEPYLSKVCPPKLLEGDYQNGNAAYLPQRIYGQYALLWNKTMLPTCYLKMEKQFPREIALNKAQRLWNPNHPFESAESMGTPPRYYRFTLNSSKNYGNQALSVTVQNGVVTKVVNQKTQQNLPIQNIPSIGVLFSLMHSAIYEKYLKIEVRYSSTLGYPELIQLQKDKNSPLIIYRLKDVKIFR